MNQLGISPKVLGPFLLSLVGAAVLYLVGQHDAAFGMAAAAALHLTTGYALPPGGLSVDSGPGNGSPEAPDLSGLDGPLDGPGLEAGTNPPTGAPAPTAAPTADTPTTTA